MENKIYHILTSYLLCSYWLVLYLFFNHILAIWMASIFAAFTILGLRSILIHVGNPFLKGWLQKDKV